MFLKMQQGITTATIPLLQKGKKIYCIRYSKMYGIKRAANAKLGCMLLH